MELKDSGGRRKFESGAVRDMAEGKGRCDLLPLGEIGRFLHFSDQINFTILIAIQEYIYSGKLNYLYGAMRDFIKDCDRDNFTAMLEVAKHYEDGAKKYSERNWEKGIPLHCYIDSGVRHYLKYLRGDTDEPHDRAFLWNILGAIWTQIHKPELIDLPFGKETKE